MALLYISDYSWCICFWCMHTPMLESVYFINEAADLNSSINIISHLQDPPFFRVSPRAEYLQEFGRELIIPCQAHGDPAPHITWTKVSTQFPKIMIKKWQQINIKPFFIYKLSSYLEYFKILLCGSFFGMFSGLVFQVESTPSSPFTVLSNGSLVLHPLSKNHQGAWECHATNSVTTVSKGTMVLVLGE